MRLGEIWIVDLPFSDGREQAGRRPALVVQREDGRDRTPLVTIVPLSSKLASARFSSTVVVAPDGENGLSLRSVALVFQIRALDRKRLVALLGRLSTDDLASVRSEIRFHLDL